MTTESQTWTPRSTFGTGPKAATDPEPATSFADAPGYDDAVREAKKAAASPIDGFVERVAEKVGAKASVKTVFGEPIERDGITVIPVAKVRWGFGGGSGSGPVAVGPGLAGETASEAATSRPGMGNGGGGGAMAEPVGYLEIGPDGATFQTITDARPSPAFVLASGVAAALLLRAIARLIRR